MKKGFTLIELLVFIGIFSVVVVGLITILVGIVNVQSGQSAKTEVEQQSQFLLQQIQYYVSGSRLIDMSQDVATSTITVREAAAAKDPTFIFVSGGVAYLQQGISGTAQAITSNKVSVSQFSATRHYNLSTSSVAYGTDSVSFSFVMSATSTNNTPYSQSFQSSVTVSVPVGKIAMIQQASTVNSSPSVSSISATYPTNNETSSLLIAVVGNTSSGASVSVADTAGNSWSKAANITYGTTTTGSASTSTLSFVKIAATGSGAGTSFSINFPTSTAGDLLVIGLVETTSTNGWATVTDTGSSTVSALTSVTTPAGYFLALYDAANIAGGSVTTTVTNSNSIYTDFYVAEYTDAAAAPLDVTSTNAGSAATFTSGTSTTHTAHEMIVGFSEEDAGSLGNGAGFTSENTFDGNLFQDEYVTSTGAYSSFGSNSGPGYGAAMATFEEASASGGGSSTSTTEEMNVFDATNAKNSSNTVTATLGTGAGNASLYVYEYRGAATSSSMDASSSQSQNIQTVSSGYASPTSSVELLFGTTYNGTTSEVPSAGSGFTLETSSTVADIYTEDTTQYISGPVAATWQYSLTTPSSTAIITTFK